MKKYLLALFSVLFLFAGCGGNSADNSSGDNTQPNQSTVAVTNTFLGENDDEWHKLIGGANVITYKNTENVWVPLSVSEFTTAYSVDFDSLIGGDALQITHYGEAISQDTRPATMVIEGEIMGVEIKYADIYEIIVKIDGENVTFEHADPTATVKISLPAYRNYCITKTENGVSKQEFTAYEDGITLYYAYNPSLVVPESGAYIYDYMPRPLAD